MLENGLKNFDAAIFLDEADRKMVLLRDGMRVRLRVAWLASCTLLGWCEVLTQALPCLFSRL